MPLGTTSVTEVADSSSATGVSDVLGDAVLTEAPNMTVASEAEPFTRRSIWTRAKVAEEIVLKLH